MAAKLIPDSIRDVLSYDPDTGLFSREGSTPIANPSSDGYTRIGIKGRKYLAHRLAWFFVHGETPDTIDHINGEKSDNRIANLRNVTQAQNLLNKKGKRGVYWKTFRQTTAYGSYQYRRICASYKRQNVIYMGKSILLAWHARIMAEREDHPVGLPNHHSPHGEP